MKYSDVQIAAAIVDFPGNEISYQWFDDLAGLDALQEGYEKQQQREHVRRRTETILEKGIVRGDDVVAYKLRVAKKGSHYERVSLGISALQTAKQASEKILRATDKACEDAAYALGKSHYFSSTSRKGYREFRKRYVPISRNAPEYSELEIEYRLLQQQGNILKAMLINQAASLERVEILLENTKRPLAQKHMQLVHEQLTDNAA